MYTAHSSAELYHRAEKAAIYAKEPDVPTTFAARAVALSLYIAALFAILFSLWQFERFSNGNLLSDFRAFYCAADLARQGIDPYRQEPLYSCEALPTAPPLWRADANVTDPAPLPPYALAIFIPLTLLPYAAAAALWSLFLFGAWVAVAYACRKLAQTSWIVCGAALIFAAMMSISLGQIAPVAIAAIALAALALTRGRDAWAGAAAAVAMIEPHVALPVCVALLIAVPRARLTLVTVGALLLLLSFAFGVERNVEYLLRVLPAHQLSDVADVGQFSATVLAHVLGLSDAFASRVGSVWYAVAAGVGIAAGVILGRQRESHALLALVPMAFAVFGGPYVHWQQVVGAIPAALVLLRYDRASPLCKAAVVALAIPWLYVVGWGFLIPGAVAVAALLICKLFEPSAIAGAFATVAIFCALLLINHSLPHTPPLPPFRTMVSPDALADLSWGEYVRARIPIGTGAFFWLHVPTWLGLVAVIAGTFAAMRRVSSAPAP